MSCAPSPDGKYMDAFGKAPSQSAFDALLSERAEAFGVSAAAVYYEVTGEAIIETFLGTDQDIDENSVFQAASLSKAVAAAGILMLAQARDISPDADIRPYVTALDWEDIPGGDAPVTLRALLSHTRGVNVSGFPGYAQGEPMPTNLELIKGESPANTDALRLDGETGVFTYSGGGYQLAQLFAETVSGEPFPKLIERLVFTPLGMTKSFFDEALVESQIAPLTVATADAGLLPIEGFPLTLRGSWNNYPEAAAAGLWTTPKDYAKFIRALMQAVNGKTPAGLPKAVAELMLTPVTPNYALGLAMQDWDDIDNRSFGHAGANRGYKCRFLALPAQQKFAVIMTNAPGGAALAKEVVFGLMSG
ncbi:MAG: serine hydrolase domain-containing protein [Pseudomonadota bacterium]